MERLAAMEKMAASMDFYERYKMEESRQHFGKAATDKRMEKADSLDRSTSSGCSDSGHQEVTEHQTTKAHRMMVLEMLRAAEKIEWYP